MPKTALDTTTEALRLIGVTAVDESADADDHARARQHLEAVFAELSETHGLALDWTIETVPDRLWPFMAAAVAGSICTAYGKSEFTNLRKYGIDGVRADELGGEPRRATPIQFF